MSEKRAFQVFGQVKESAGKHFEPGVLRSCMRITGPWYSVTSSAVANWSKLPYLASKKCSCIVCKLNFDVIETCHFKALTIE